MFFKEKRELCLWQTNKTVRKNTLFFYTALFKRHLYINNNKQSFLNGIKINKYNDNTPFFCSFGNHEKHCHIFHTRASSSMNKI